MSETFRASNLFYLAAAVFVAALFLGGGTRPGFLSDALLQYLSLPLLLIAGAKAARSSITSFRLSFLFCCAMAMVPLIQLVPLPSGIRGMLPGKQLLEDTFTLLGQPVPYWPLSLAPHATWLSLLSLIPPVAIFFGASSLGHRDRRKLAVTLIIFSSVSVFLGLLQLSQGAASSLRFFKFTNVEDAVGFFANRNHFSALLYCATVLCAAWALNTIAARSGELVQRKTDTHAIAAIAGSLLILAILVMAQAMARSRAGMILSIIALFAVLPLSLTGNQVQSSLPRGAKIVYAVTAFAVVFSLQFALYRILSRFGPDALADTRIVFARNTLRAAREYLPFGSGMGTFVWVYPQFESQADLLYFFANRAHNDIVELLLETGVLGALFMVVFFAAYLRRTIAIWSGAALNGVSEADARFMKAATIVVALLAIHSFLDYPLRTSAMACVAALSCAMMMPVRHHHHEERHEHRERPEHRGFAPDEPPPQAQAAPPPRPAAASNNTIDEAWKRAAQQASARGEHPDIPLKPTRPAPQSRPAERWQSPTDWPAEWKSDAGPSTSDKKDGSD